VKGDEHAKAVELHPAAGLGASAATTCLRRAAPNADQPGRWRQVVDRVTHNEQLLYGQIRNFSPLVGNVYPESETDKDLARCPQGTKYFLAAKLREGCEPGAPDRNLEQGEEAFASIGNFSVSRCSSCRTASCRCLHRTNGFDRQHYKFDYVRREFLAKCAAWCLT